MKFFREIRLLDEEDEALELREKAMAQIEQLAARARTRGLAFEFGDES